MFSHLQFKPQVISPQVSKVHIRSSFPTSFHMFSSARKEFLPRNFLLFERSIMQTKHRWHNVQVQHKAWIEYMMCSKHLTSYLCEVLEEQGWSLQPGGARINVEMCFWRRIHTIVFPLSRINSFILTSLIACHRKIFCWKQEGLLKFQEGPF